jgi:cell shape-determining protein MreD
MRAIHPALLLLATYLAVYLECRITWVRDLIGVQPDFLPALVVYASLTSNLATVTLLAFCGGLWFDSLSLNPTGVTVFPLLVTGMGLLWFRDLILRDQPYARQVLGFAAGVAVPALSLLLMLSLGAEPPVGWGTLWTLLVLGLAGAGFTPLVFAVFDRLRKLFEFQPLETTSLREDREIKRGRN